MDGIGVDTDYAAAIAYLDDHAGRGVKPGLERIRGLLDLLADPQDGYPIVHVAGTNGKTSTVRMTANLISAHGLTPGSFTSPHLRRVEERYEYGLQAMTAAELAAAVSELAPVADLYEERAGDLVTYFEFTAALAHVWFSERAVDAAVIETGLGGRLDATNAASSEVAVVTTIGLEHTAYLGDTIAEIAAEKLAILDEGASLVTGDLHPEAQDVAAGVAADIGRVWFSLGRDFGAEDARLQDTGWGFDLTSIYGDYTDIELHLRGRHQVDNFSIAVASVEALLGRALDEAGVRQAAASVTSPGRMEVVSREPLVLMDGAHNPEATGALAAALRTEFPEARWNLVFGVMGDKDLEAMLKPFDGLIDQAHTAAVDSPRALGPTEAAAGIVEGVGVPARAHASVADALAVALESGDPVLVTGSIYVVGEARAALLS